MAVITESGTPLSRRWVTSSTRSLYGISDPMTCAVKIVVSTPESAIRATSRTPAEYRASARSLARRELSGTAATTFEVDAVWLDGAVPSAMPAPVRPRERQQVNINSVALHLPASEILSAFIDDVPRVNSERRHSRFHY